MAVLEFERPLRELEENLSRLRNAAEAVDPGELEALEAKARALRAQLYGDLGAWDKVQLSRHPDRPYTLDYLQRLTEDFVELHGDRLYSDDHAIVGGLARFRGRSVMVVGHQKGRGVKDAMHRNFGMPHPEGYRKSRRLMELAGRFGRPVLTFIDTPGAYPGLGAEERGQSEAIGQALATMATLPVPIIAVVIGEGGSGGALALGLANRVLMLEYATYSVISPEGCASILWKDGSRAADAAVALRITAEAQRHFGIVDEVIAEPEGGAHRDHDDAALRVGDALERHLRALESRRPENLCHERYERFRKLGRYTAGDPE
ncbi:MAG: acetyl-CoA carboxylase carboxyltransferase subunit alpha [Deltaproteobacteria bacterium]|nr:acetyl-CoA carboxylase carboxyltransferase subunit alpha [Deltaproteobacteria bacterium]